MAVATTLECQTSETTTGRYASTDERTSSQIFRRSEEGWVLTDARPGEELAGFPRGKELAGFPVGKELAGFPVGKELAGFPRGKELAGFPRGKELALRSLGVSLWVDAIYFDPTA